MRGARRGAQLAHMATDTPAQLSLSLVEQRVVAAGIATGADDLPAGIGELGAKELKFVLGVLEHGQMARAATEAGYSADSAGSIASEVLRKPKVFAFYRRCLEKVASKAEVLTARVYERSVALHAKALQATQDVEDADQWLLLSFKEERGPKGKDVKEYELRRERALRDQKHYVTLANQTDALLGQLLGKIAGVHVSGEIKVKGEGAVVTVPAAALPAMAQLRREVVTADAASGGPN